MVGAGHMGQYHILALAELWDVELVAICDADAGRAEQIAAQYGTRAVATHRELAELVDIATVAVPTERHFEVARDLLEAGVHVLVEKPMTPTLEEAKELFRLARQRARVLHVGHVERFNGAVQELRKIVEQPSPHRVATARPLRAAGAERLGRDGPHDPRHRHRAGPRGQRAAPDEPPSGARSTRARPTSPTCRSSSTPGAMATITASRATEEKIRTLSITQPDAYIVLNYADQDIQIHRRAAQEYTLNRESIRYRQASFVERLFVHKDNPLKLEIRHLISAARAAKATGQVELPETEDLRSLAVALEIERMIREGRGEVAWPKDLPWSAASR